MRGPGQGDAERQPRIAAAGPQQDNEPGREGTYRFLTTGDPLGFKEMGSRFLQLPIADVERVTVAELERVAA